MEMIDEIKKDIPEGKYLDMCNLLKKMYNEEEITFEEKKMTALRQELERYDKKMNRRVNVYFEDDILHPYRVYIGYCRATHIGDNVWEYKPHNDIDITIEVQYNAINPRASIMNLLMDGYVVKSYTNDFALAIRYGNEN